MITSAVFHPGEVSVAYAPVTLAAKGGVPPYLWSISVGSLPAGLSVSAGGSVSGTPTASGTSFFTVHVADTVGGSAIVNRSISVAKRLTVTALCGGRAGCSVELGCVTVCGKFGALVGGVSPFKYVLTQGPLPPGMGLNGLALTGQFPAPQRSPTGAPLPYVVGVSVTDSVGATASVTGAFNVFPHIAWVSTGGTCSGYVVSGCTASLGYSLGKDPTTVTVQEDLAKYPALPKGSAFTASGGKVSVSIPGPGCGSPYANTGFFSVVMLSLTDASPCGPGYNCATSNSIPLTIRLAVC